MEGIDRVTSSVQWKVVEFLINHNGSNCAVSRALHILFEGRTYQKHALPVSEKASVAMRNTFSAKLEAYGAV